MFNYGDKVLAPKAVPIEGTREYKSVWTPATVTGFSHGNKRVSDLYVEYEDGGAAWTNQLSVERI